MYNMVLYYCVLIVFSLHRESLKLILATDPIPRWFCHKKFGPFMNIMYVKWIDMIALGVIQSLISALNSNFQSSYIIQSLNLRNESPRDCCIHKMISFFLDVFSIDLKCFCFFLDVIAMNEIKENNYDVNILWKKEILYACGY
jgi:hypothetical protein